MSRAKDRNQIYVQIAAFRDERAALIPIVEAIPEVRRLKALEDTIGALERLAEATRQRTGARIVETPQDSEFARLSLPKAAIKYLERVGQPQSPEEIWDALSSGGVTVTSRRPIHAVDVALKKHTPKNPRLQRIDGKWSIRPLPKGGVAKSGLPRHKELTKEGIAHFKARTGATWGRKPSVTAAHIEKFREAFDRGETVIASARAAGVSNAYFYMHREALLAWKKGDPWPPPGGAVNEYRAVSAEHALPSETGGDELRATGVIPFQARLIGEDK
jgi:hypothetical protein